MQLVEFCAAVVGTILGAWTWARYHGTVLMLQFYWTLLTMTSTPTCPDSTQQTLG